MAVSHAFTSGKSAAADTTLVDGPNWDADHVISGGNLGALLYQGTAGAPSLINSVAAGRLLVSDGAAAVPVWRTELQVTASAVTSTVPISVAQGTAAAPGIYSTGDATTGLFGVGAGWAALFYSYAGTAKWVISGAGTSMRLASTFSLEWQASADVNSGGSDVVLSRAAPNRLLLAVGDVFNLAPTAYASLPTGAEGDLACVTDSNTATWGATIAGGGANNVLAYFNGTNWTVAGA